VYLGFLDESGNTGSKLDDPDQPVHWLAAVLVPENNASALSHHLDDVVRLALPHAPTAEVHAAELHHGDGPWRGASPSDRVKVVDEFLDALTLHQCSVFHASIDKARLAQKYTNPGSPHLLAFQFMCEKIQEFLTGQTDELRKRALLIADETHEHERYALHQFRRQQVGEGGVVSGPATDRLIDNIHFVRSEDSRAVQLADVVAYSLNRHSRLVPEHPTYDAYARFSAKIDGATVGWRQTWPSG